MTRASLHDLVDCYKTSVIQDKRFTYDKYENPNGRWRCFTQEEVASIVMMPSRISIMPFMNLYMSGTTR